MRSHVFLGRYHLPLLYRPASATLRLMWAQWVYLSFLQLDGTLAWMELTITGATTHKHHLKISSLFRVLSWNESWSARSLNINYNRMTGWGILTGQKSFEVQTVRSTELQLEEWKVTSLGTKVYFM